MLSILLTSGATQVTFVPTGDGEPPSIPTNLTATPISISQIDLAWTASTDNVGVTGYRIYRNNALVNELASTSYSDGGLTEATLYSYAVSAIDAAGNESARSISASATTFSTSIGSTPALESIGATTSSATLAATHTLAHPATVAANNLLLCIALARNGNQNASLAMHTSMSSAGWQHLTGSPYSDVSPRCLLVAWKLAVGNEGGTNVPGGIVGSGGATDDFFLGQILRWSAADGWFTPTPFEVITSALKPQTGTTAPPNLTPAGNNRRAVCIFGGNAAPASFTYTGEAGGDWTLASHITGTASVINVQSADLSPGNPITGGSATMTIGASGPVVGFCLVPSAAGDVDPPPDMPNTVLATSNLRDTALNVPPVTTEDIIDDPIAPDSDWWTAVSATADTAARVGFPTPPAATPPSGDQAFAVALRKTAGTPNPTADLQLYENGALVSTLLSGVAVSSLTGQAISAGWNASLLATASGANVECRVVGHVGTAGVSVNPVSFDGTNDWLEVGTPTGVSDVANATISFWYRMTALGASRQIIQGQSSRINVLINASNQMRVQFRNSAGANTFDVTFPATTDNSWHHVMAATNGTAGQAYLDGTAATPTVSGGAIDWTVNGIAIGGSLAGASLHNGDLAEVWLDDTYLDLSVAANRQKFLLGGGPVSLGAAGATPTGASPLIFLSGATASWHTNKGTGGGFTVHGALTTGAVALPAGSGGGAATNTVEIGAIRWNFASADEPPGGETFTVIHEGDQVVHEGDIVVHTRQV